MKKIDYRFIPNCLRKYRKARGLRQKDVAEIIGLKGTGIISRWEQGICLPNSLNIFKLAVLYRTLVDALFIDLIRSLKEKLLKKEEEILKTKNK
jgi:transcriptional regulator with XRE-family HTH domain